ncbi:MAG TPA: transposase [Anaerolineales bacterium]|nr:transposase [Anaerolineales bacterium]
MLTRIVHNSTKLCTFIDQLDLNLSKPQRQHIRNLADALLVCEDEKTLAALQRQFLEAPDASNVADFLRISPWRAEDVRGALRINQVQWAIVQAESQGLPKIMYLNLDDSLGEKDQATRHLEPVDWFHDHSESTKSKPVFKNAFCYLVATVRIGKIVVTVDLRLYLRAKTVRRLNRQRQARQRLSFRSKNSLARSMLEALRPRLPAGWTVFVQFDSWYASEQLIKYVRRQGWHVTCGLKHNRKLNGQRIDQIASALRHRRYTHIQVTAADGNQTTYFVRQTTGRLKKVPFDIRVFFSKRHPREKSPAYFMSTDLTRSAQQALQGYSGRWSCEVGNFYLKTQLGLADFRVQSYQAVDKYMLVVLLTWAYVERRFQQERCAQIKTYGDLIRRHRDEHAIDWLTGAVKMMQETGDLQLVLQRYLRLESLPA